MRDRTYTLSQDRDSKEKSKPFRVKVIPPREMNQNSIDDISLGGDDRDSNTRYAGSGMLGKVKRVESATFENNDLTSPGNDELKS